MLTSVGNRCKQYLVLLARKRQAIRDWRSHTQEQHSRTLQVRVPLHAPRHDALCHASRGCLQEIDQVIARPSTAPAPVVASDGSADAAAAAAEEERERVRDQVRIWRQQRDEKAALEAQKRAEAAAAERPKTAPVSHRPLSAPTRRNMTPVRHISDPNDVALTAARKPLDSALHEKRVADAMQLQRSRAAAADALKAKTKVPRFFVALIVL